LPAVKSARMLQVCHMDTSQRSATEVVPEIPEAAVPLWNREHLDGREPRQRLATRGAVPGRAVAGRRRALEAERGDVERLGEKPEDMVRPDPDPAVRGVRERLAQEQKLRPHAGCHLLSSTITLLENPRRIQNRARSVRP